ncbi:MAG TPA: GNAT family N-acetyltransferase [Patescibacteria group bacterium]
MNPTEENLSKPKVTVRFFNSNDSEDFVRLKEIVESPNVKKWMADLRGMGPRHYRDWMDESGQYNYYTFAVVLADPAHPLYNKPQGFIYIYPSDLERGTLEVSFAKHPGAPSGLIKPALRVALLKVAEYYAKKTGRTNPPLKVIAEIEPDNEPSRRVVWGAGFEEDEEYEEDNDIYVLNWERLKEIMRIDGQL